MDPPCLKEWVAHQGLGEGFRPGDQGAWNCASRCMVRPDQAATSAQRTGRPSGPRAGCRIRTYAGNPSGTTAATADPNRRSRGPSQSAAVTSAEGCSTALEPTRPRRSGWRLPVKLPVRFLVRVLGRCHDAAAVGHRAGGRGASPTVTACQWIAPRLTPTQPCPVAGPTGGLALVGSRVPIRRVRRLATCW